MLIFTLSLLTPYLSLSLSLNQSFNGALILIYLLAVPSFASSATSIYLITERDNIYQEEEQKPKRKKDLLMDNSPSPIFDSQISEEILETQASKKRKMVQKTVVTVKIKENENGKQKSEGPPPSDYWSWRKYGQKPIKGSPYPRGYYRCSTSKGCSAKKQVERCRTDASLLIITYTSTHNHPGPKDPKQEEAKTQITQENNRTTPKEEGPKEPEEEKEKEQQSLFDEDGASEKITSNFHYCQSPFNSSDHQDIIINIKHEEDIIPYTEHLENVLVDEKENPLCYPHLMTFSTPKSEENDFYDELGELPISSSSFTSSFMRSNFFEDRILIQLP